jgi:hypothetical protein
MRRRAFGNHELVVVVALAALWLGIALPICARIVELLGGRSSGLGTHLLALLFTILSVTLVPAALCLLCMLVGAAVSLVRLRRSRDVTRLVRLVGALACCGAGLLAMGIALGAAAAPSPAPLAVGAHLLLCLGCVAAAAHFFPREEWGVRTTIRAERRRRE